MSDGIDVDGRAQVHVPQDGRVALIEGAEVAIGVAREDESAASGDERPYSGALVIAPQSFAGFGRDCKQRADFIGTGCDARAGSNAWLPPQLLGQTKRVCPDCVNNVSGFRVTLPVAPPVEVARCLPGGLGFTPARRSWFTLVSSRYTDRHAASRSSGYSRYQFFKVARIPRPNRRGWADSVSQEPAPATSPRGRCRCRPSPRCTACHRR
jgi:hypothetical protein